VALTRDRDMAGRFFGVAPSLFVFTAAPPFSALRPLRDPEQYASVHRFAGETREPDRSAPAAALSGRSGGQPVGSLGYAVPGAGREDIPLQGVTAAEGRGGGLEVGCPLPPRRLPHRHVRVPEENEKRNVHRQETDCLALRGSEADSAPTHPDSAPHP
jgi:hypothetical protein